MSIRLVDGSYAAPYQTRWGEGWVYVRDGELAGVDLPGEAGGPCKLSADCPEVGAGDEPGGAAGPAAPDAEALAFWVGELQAYFRGERTTWTPKEVPLGCLGLGVFERGVYEALLSVPPGETVTYGELAEMAGYPRAARAVGNAMANNPIPVVVPCHRVVRSNGSLGNYGNDPSWKERLLRHEGWTCAGGNAGGSAERS